MKIAMDKGNGHFKTDALQEDLRIGLYVNDESNKKFTEVYIKEEVTDCDEVPVIFHKSLLDVSVKAEDQIETTPDVFKAGLQPLLEDIKPINEVFIKEEMLDACLEESAVEFQPLNDKHFLFNEEAQEGDNKRLRENDFNEFDFSFSQKCRSPHDISLIHEAIKIGCETKKKRNRSISYQTLQVNDEIKYKCTTCDYSSSRKGNLRHHIRSVHEKLKPHQCPICEFSCSHKGSLLIHVRSVHQKVRPHKCSICEFSFTNKASLNQHVLSIHEKVKPHNCKICDSAFSQKSSLRQHVLSVHEKVRPHECTICGSRFYLKRNVEIHIRSVHEKKKPYKCSICESYYSRKYTLIHHIKTVHDKVKTIICPVCGLWFSNKCDRSLHIRSVHDKETKPHKCPECNTSFSQRGSLSRHIRSIHKKVNPHKCLVCERSFRDKDKLSLHVISAHDGVSGNP